MSVHCQCENLRLGDGETENYSGRVEVAHVIGASARCGEVEGKRGNRDARC